MDVKPPYEMDSCDWCQGDLFLEARRQLFLEIELVARAKRLWGKYGKETKEAGSQMVKN